MVSKQQIKSIKHLKSHHNLNAVEIARILNLEFTEVAEVLRPKPKREKRSYRKKDNTETARFLSNGKPDEDHQRAWGVSPRMALAYLTGNL